MGALKVAAIPAAAPQATRTLSRSLPTLSHCPNVEPRLEPICTMGPSRPTEPPVAMVNAETKALRNMIRDLIFPPLKATASMTWDPVPLGFAAEEIHEGTDNQPADGRY